MVLVAWIQVVLGVSIAGLWAALLVTGQVPEVEAGQTDIWFHIAAELATAAMLLLGGVSILRRYGRARPMAALALGMVAYSAIASAGYYAESGDWAFVVMFGVALGLAGFAFVRVCSADG